MKNDVFVVDPPTNDNPGQYLLVVSRGGLMGSTTSFIVDRLVDKGKDKNSVQGVRFDSSRKSHIVVEFSKDSSYIMIERNLVRPTNALAIEIEEREAQEEYKKALEAKFPPEKQDAVAVTADGRQKVNAQGYL